MSAQLEALRALYEAGAFLIRAQPDKSPLRKLVQPRAALDAAGNIARHPDGKPIIITERMRCAWRLIELHVKSGGHVLYYRPGAQGILILDFDPLIAERLEATEGLLGAPAYRSFQSSGKWKKPEGDRPAGFGGHATWAISSTPIETPRHFTDEPEGTSFGEAFAHHPGLAVIVWNAVALAETMELDEAERIDPARLHSARFSLARRNERGEWEAGTGSRHDAAVSEAMGAARSIDCPNRFERTLADIKARFEASVERGRIASGEWQRIETAARRRWAQGTRLITPTGTGSNLIGARRVPRSSSG